MIQEDLTRQSALGQVWTPDKVAQKMSKLLLDSLPLSKKLSILDPAVGPATFPKALMTVAPERNFSITAYDVDSRMTALTSDFASCNSQTIQCFNSDFLRCENPGIFDAIIMNPPYIRQELIDGDAKALYYNVLEADYGEKLNRRSNLFVLFLLKAMSNLAPGGVLCAIVYEAIANCTYGKQAMKLLNERAETIYQEHISEPFGEAIIDARIILWKKYEVNNNKQASNNTIENKNGMVPLGTLMDVRRGTTLPYRKLFLPSSQHPMIHFAKPILVKQRNPDLFTCQQFDFAFTDLADVSLRNYLTVEFLKQGLDISKISVKPISGDICFNYYLRDKPRHLFNEAHVDVSDNFYVGKPLNDFPSLAAWILLNSDMYTNCVMANGRNQGNGLTKLQICDYKAAMVPDWGSITKEKLTFLLQRAHELLHAQLTYNTFRMEASELAQWIYQ